MTTASIEPVQAVRSAQPASVRECFPVLAQANTAYLDCAATALMPASVIAAQLEYDEAVRANAGRGIHRMAEAATAAVAKARTAAASLLCAEREQIALVAGATAGLNLVALAISQTLRPGDRIAVSVAEHHSNFVPWQAAAKRSGAEFVVFGLDEQGAPDIKALSELDPAPKVIALTHASNVTGAPTDLLTAAQFAASCGATLVVDGAQMMPHAPLSAAPPGDFYAFAGHKCHAPTGIGVLYARDGFAGLDCPFAGGGSVTNVTATDSGRHSGAQGWEAGTPPISQAVGLAAAVEWLENLDRSSCEHAMNSHAAHLIGQLEAMPGIRVLGAPADMKGRLPLVSFTVDNIHPHDVCELLNEDDVAVRGGHQCAQPLMAALGLPASGCVRASLGPHTDDADIMRLLNGIEKAQATLC